MSELISLFRRASANSTSEYQNRPLGRSQANQPEYFTQLLQYLREKRRQQGQALRAAISALAEAD